MAEGNMSSEEETRHRVGMAQQEARRVAGIDWRPGEKWTEEHQAAFDANLRLKKAREDAQKPKSPWQRLRSAIGIF